jgi:hypothetical protein
MENYLKKFNDWLEEKYFLYLCNDKKIALLAYKDDPKIKLIESFENEKIEEKMQDFRSWLNGGKIPFCAWVKHEGEILPFEILDLIEPDTRFIKKDGINYVREKNGK